MNVNKQNIAQIVESWTPAIKQITKNRVNEENQDRLEWMCVYAHNHVMALNEANASWTGGTSFPVQTLYNTNGIGNPTLAQQPGMTAADQNSPAAYGSGDKWPSLLPMALQVAARTIGFDLVNNFPFQGPSGVIPFMDYVYSGSKGAYGATYSYDGDTANPQVAVGNRKPAYELYEAPHAFRCILEVDPSSGITKKDAVKAIVKECDEKEYMTLKNASNGAEMRVQFIGLARLNANPMFKVHPEDKNVALGKIFGAGASLEVTVGKATFTLRRPRLISALEDQILGFTGSGKYDSDRWSGTYMDPKHLYEPMDRGTGEMQYPRQMSLSVFTKYVTVGTQSIAVAVTQEQVQDLQKQWGIDVIKLVENAAINELSQSINKHILSRLFALGWKNHVQAYEAEGINLNLDMTQAYNPAVDPEEVEFATYDDEGREVLMSMPVPGYTKYGTGAFENAETMFKKIYVNMLAAGNMIMQRGRRGPANFVVANWKIATMMQSNAQYSFSPIANTINQNNGSLYPAGNVAGMTLYVDPMMHTQDTRILVGRKGDKDEPGVAFCPYILAESVKMISEHTAAPKVVVKSRYNLVDLGWYPQLNYVTFYIKGGETIV